MPRGRPRKDALIKSAEMIGWALGGLEREIERTRERLSALNAEAAKLRTKMGVGVRGARGAADTPAGGGRRRRRRMSAEARKRISEMMKKRWAERKRKSS